MNAEEAKKLALANKKVIEETKVIKKQTLEDETINLLYNHLMTKVEEAVKKGQLSTDKIEFSSDQFSDKVIQEVANKLNLNDFTLNKEHHNAYKKVIFTVSWA